MLFDVIGIQQIFDYKSTNEFIQYLAISEVKVQRPTTKFSKTTLTVLSAKKVSVKLRARKMTLSNKTTYY